MANIRDVARQAGVSIASVSAVINQTGRVGEATRRRVWAAVEVVGYSPNAIARSLRTGRSNLIGVIVSDITNPFASAFVRVVERAALAGGYSVVICNADGNDSRVRANIDQLRAQRVAGILLPAFGDRETLSRRIGQQPQPPIVTYDQKLPGLARDFVGFDNRASIRLLVDYLARLGHRSIALITGKRGRWTADERYEGFIEAMADAALSVDPALVARSGYESESAYGAAAAMMQRRQRPSAILAANNVTALGALQSCIDLGFRCPADVSIVGVDDVPWSGLVRPRLSIASHPVETMAEIATAWLLERINRADAQPAPREMISAAAIPCRGIMPRYPRPGASTDARHAAIIAKGITSGRIRNPRNRPVQSGGRVLRPALWVSLQHLA